MVPNAECHAIALPPEGMPALKTAFAREGYVTVGMGFSVPLQAFRLVIDEESLKVLGDAHTRELLRSMNETARDSGADDAFSVAWEECGGPALQVLADPDLYYDLPERVGDIMRRAGGPVRVVDAVEADVRHMARHLSGALGLDPPSVGVLDRPSVFDELLSSGYPAAEEPLPEEPEEAEEPEEQADDPGPSF